MFIYDSVMDIHVLLWCFFFFQAEDGIRDLVRSRGLGDVYKRQAVGRYLSTSGNIKGNSDSDIACGIPSL